MTEATTTTTPARTAVDAYRISSTKRILDHLPLILATFERVNRRMEAVAVRDLIDEATSLVELVKEQHLAPFVEQADGSHWRGGAAFRRDVSPGIQALGIGMQLRAMHATPGLGDALIQLMVERVEAALGA